MSTTAQTTPTSPNNTNNTRLERTYKTCDTCRYRQTLRKIPPANLITLSEVVHEFLEPEEVGENGVCLEVDIAMDENLLAHSDEQIHQLLLEEIHLCDGYEYFLKHAGNPGLKFSVTFEAVCSQDVDGCRHIEESRLRRRYQRIEEYPCNGKVFGSVNRRYRWINLIATHHVFHPRPAALEARMIRTVPMTQEIRDYIGTRITTENLNCIGLYEDVVANFGYVVNRGQVLTAWRASFVSQYKMAEDQLQSCRILVRNLAAEANCEELMFRSVEGVQYFGFKTGFFELLVQSDQVTEFHVDSTYKTNRAGFELFGVVANVYGSGYPIAYMIMKVDGRANNNAINELDTNRIAVLKIFFQTMKDQGLNPTFMYCDKDTSEINAIESVWQSDRTIVRLCLWHIKRAVNHKLKSQCGPIPPYFPGDGNLSYPELIARLQNDSRGKRNKDTQ